MEDNRPLLKAIIQEAFFAVKSEIKRVLIFGLVFLLLLLFNIVPVIGSIVYIILGFLWACFGCAFEFTSFSADRRHLDLKRKIANLRRQLPFSMGFGLITFLLFIIPFLNVLNVSVSAVSGSFAFCMLSAGLENQKGRL